MRVFVTGGTGHSGSYVIPELIVAGHEVTGLARSDTAAALSALGAKVRRGDLQDLDGLKEAATDSDDVIHLAHRQEKGFAGYPGDGANLWGAVHVRDVASLFRLALEKGPAGRYWHAVEDGASRSAR